MTPRLLKALVSRRRELKMKQSEVAVRMGVSRQQVYNIENAKNPRIDTLLKYAAAVDADIVFTPHK